MESPKFEKLTAKEKLAAFLEKWRFAFVIVFACAILAVIGISIFSTVRNSQNKSGLNALDKISYELSVDSAKLSADELETRRQKALEELVPYLKKSSIVGVTANRLQAEILFSQKKYAEAADFYLTSVKKDSSSYLTPLGYFNAAACYENAGDYENAAKYYEKAATFKDNLQSARAYFSLGRVKEKLNDKDGAIKAYNDLLDAFADGEWTNLAKSRLITLENK